MTSMGRSSASTPPAIGGSLATNRPTRSPGAESIQQQQRRFAAIRCGLSRMLCVHLAHARLDGDSAAVPEDRLDVVAEEFLVERAIGVEAEDRRIASRLGEGRAEALRD